MSKRYFYVLNMIIYYYVYLFIYHVDDKYGKYLHVLSWT